jgi:hypothetical protein
MTVHDHLEALRDGTLADGLERELRSHLEACDECRADLAWLKAERQLMTERVARGLAPDVAWLWAGIERRLGEPTLGAPPRRQVRHLPWLAGPMLAAAAAMVAMFIGPRAYFVPEQQAPAARAQAAAKRDPKTALAKAETEVAAAAGVLEQRYLAERDRLGPGRTVAIEAIYEQSRARLAEAKTVLAAQTDVPQRLAYLEGYSSYVHTLQGLVADLEVTR